MSTFSYIFVVTRMIPCVVSYTILNCCILTHTLGLTEFGNIFPCISWNELSCSINWGEFLTSWKPVAYQKGLFLMELVYMYVGISWNIYSIYISDKRYIPPKNRVLCCTVSSMLFMESSSSVKLYFNDYEMVRRLELLILFTLYCTIFWYYIFPVIVR
jgi:hypothetical protein